MSAGNVKSNQIKPPENIDKGTAIREAVAFILPSVIITASSILLFSLLNGFTAEQHNRFVTIIFLAIIPSLLGTAAFQVVTYRIIEENAEARNTAAGKSLFFGSAFAIIFSVAVGGLVYGFSGSLGLTLSDFSYFAVLLILFTMIWIYLATFWASRLFFYPVIIVTFGFLSILAITFGFHRVNPEYTISGYTLGVFLLFVTAMVASLRIFGHARNEKSRTLKISLPSLVTNNISIIIFSILYVLVIFLDKIIVWVYRGSQVGMALLIPGPYTIGAFLGLVPIFSVVAAIYFGRATSQLVEKRYEGTLAEIRRRTARYLKMYRMSLGYILLIWAALFMTVVGLVYFLLPDILIYRTTITIGVASLFLVLILYNSQFLATFGEGRISAFAGSIVVAGELASIFFVHIDVWFAAAGFLVGAILGFMLSEICILILSRDFEFHIYRYATRCAEFR